MAAIFDLDVEFERLNALWIRGLRQFDRQIAEDYKWLEKVTKEGLNLIRGKANNKLSISKVSSKISQISPKRATKSNRSSANRQENDPALPAQKISVSSIDLETSEIAVEKIKPNVKLNKDTSIDAPIRKLRPRAAKGKTVQNRSSSKKVSNDENEIILANIANASPPAPPPPLPLVVPSRTPDVPVVTAKFPYDPVVALTPLKPQKPAKPPRTTTPLRPVMVLAESKNANVIHTSKASLVLSTEKVPRMMIARVTCSPLKLAAQPEWRSERKKSSTSKSSKTSRGSKKKSGNDKRSCSGSVEILAKMSCSRGSLRRSSQEKRSRASTEVTYIEESLRSSLEDNNAMNAGEDDLPPAKKFKNLPTKVDLTDGYHTVIIHTYTETKGPSESNGAVNQSDKPRAVALPQNIAPPQRPRTRSRPSVTTDEGTNSEGSVISESPSPKCPRGKVVRTKAAAAATAATEKPVRGRMMYSLRSRAVSSSVTPSSSSESVKSKKTIKANVQRSSSCSSLYKNTHHRSNSFLCRNSPMPMTPAEKTEKRRIQLQEKELKQMDVLKKREERVKKILEEKKKKREERMKKVHAAREQQEQEALKKLHLEQMRAKEQEELNHKLATVQKLERDKAQREEDERRYEAFLEMKRMQRLVRQQKEEEKRLLEKERLEKEKLEKERAEKERIAREKEEMARVQKANEARVQNAKAATPKPNMNVTVTIDDKQDTSVYDITLNRPQSKYMEPSANADNYGIDHLDSEESTDDEAKPKKKIPRWASGIEFRKLLMAQINKNINVDGIFPHEVLLVMPDLVEIFGRKAKRFHVRTSSAHWNSPPYNMRSATPKLNN